MIVATVEEKEVNDKEKKQKDSPIMQTNFLLETQLLKSITVFFRSVKNYSLF